MKTIQNKTLILVIRGNFNPGIFHPSWFAMHSLLSKTETDSAEIKLITPEISDFAIDWATFQITLDRFLLKTTQESHFQSLFDLVLGTFTILNQTPVRQLGINFEGEFQFNDEKEWNNYGDILAPKPLWEKKLKSPGLNSIQMKCERDDDNQGYIMVTVKPSTDLAFGVTLHFNDHFELKKNEVHSIAQLLETIQNERNASINRSLDIFQSLLEV